MSHILAPSLVMSILAKGRDSRVSSHTSFRFGSSFSALGHEDMPVEAYLHASPGVGTTQLPFASFDLPVHARED